jgi:geranylgeranyl diphosphate synthase, type I
MSGGEMQAGAESLWSISAEIDRALRAFVDRQPLGDFYELVRYHLGWMAEGAGLLRPRAVLCVVSCQACGGTFDQALPAAVAIALLQGFELHQEDLERQRPSRHGRQSVWTVWGRPQAMNAGDGMHALAKMALLEDRERLSAAAILHLQQELDESCLRCCEAIHLDQAAAAAHAISAGTLERAANKTAILFGYAAYAGCYVACAGQSSLVPCLRHFGELLGSAAGVKPLSPSRAAAFRADAIAAFKSPGIAAEHQAALRDLTDYVLDSEI